MYSLWKEWLSSKALPLWGQNGFDTAHHLYHEHLNFDHTPRHLDALRLMVQARQIATFCQAACDGLSRDADQAQSCLETVEKIYYRPDGQAGWIFSATPSHHPADTTRDLYAHAFILFAYACSYKHSPLPSRLHIARQTIDDLEKIFHTHNGGFLDTVPSSTPIRRQNPHMHLLEAYLTLFEVSQDEFYLEKARQLLAFSLTTFISPHFTMLSEFFDAHWAPPQPAGKNHVEAGHLFEWAWLLNEFNRLSSSHTPLNKQAQLYASAFFKNGQKYGMQGTIVLNAMTDDGTLLDTSYRLWPQTELMRLLARHANAEIKQRSDLLKEMSHTFFNHFAPPSLNGGWIDRFHNDGSPSTDSMPASSLYHIYSAAREILCHSQLSYSNNSL